MRLSRRRLLGTAATGLAGGVAGCSSAVESLTREASVAWRVETPVRAFRAGETRVYVRSPGEVTAYETADGSVAWRAPTWPDESPKDGSVWRMQPWMRGNLHVGPRFVYAYGPDGVVALDPADGQRVWSAAGSYQSLFRAAETLTAYTSDGTETVGFDPATGERRWSWTDVMVRERTPRYGLSSGDELTVVDLGTGEVRWSLTAGEDERVVTVDGDTLYVAVAESSGSLVRALATADGAERWRRDLPLGTDYGRVLDGTLYVSSRGQVTVHALDPASGAERWRTPIPGWSTNAIPRVPVGERVVFGQSWWKGSLPNACALERETGHLAWQRSDHEVVAAADGTTALATTQGRFVGLAGDGERRWERSLDFVTMVGGGGEGYYYPPVILPADGRFVTGFEGTNVLYEYTVGSGLRTWKLHLDEPFLSLRRVGAALYAVDENGVTKVTVG